MKILAIDDEPMMLDELVGAITKALPEAEVASFTSANKLLEYVKQNAVDVAFLDIELGVMSGLDLAKELKKLYPTINIIFVTGYSQYATDAFQLHASGYLIKPVTANAVRKELDDLRNVVNETLSNGVVAKCFGKFEIYHNGEPIGFERSKTKELLAFLIDAQGSSVSTVEICTALWEEDGRKYTKYLQVLKHDLVQTLNREEIANIVRIGFNRMSVDTSLISCDYYEYLNNTPKGIQAFNGQYMEQYSWADGTRDSLHISNL